MQDGERTEQRVHIRRKFQGNILAVGRTGCGKTTFIQNWEKINFLETK